MVPAYVEDDMMVSDYAEEPCPNWVEVQWGPVYCNLWACLNVTLTGYIYKVTEEDTCTGITKTTNKLAFCGVCIP